MSTQITKRNIKISLLTDQDIDEAISFYNSVYKGERDRAKFLWEFQNAPAGRAIYVIAKDEDTQKIVGTQCAIPIELITSLGRKILTAKSEDTLVDPNYRGLQIFEKMYELLFEACKKNNIKYIWGFTSALKPFRKLGFDIPFDHSQSLMVFKIKSSFRYLAKLNPKNKTKSLIKIFILCIISRLTTFKKYLNFTKSQLSNLECSVAYKTNNFADEEMQEFGFTDSFTISMNNSFYHWRIIDNPYHEVVIKITFSSDSKVIAKIIFNYHKNGVWYLVNDIYSNDINEFQRIQIFKEAIKQLTSQKVKRVDLIRTWDFRHNQYHHNEIKLREKAGFVHIERGISFVWKLLDENENLDVKNFILSRIASQGVI